MKIDAVTRDALEEELNKFGFRLFKYLDKRFEDLNKSMVRLDEKYDKLTTTLDAFLKRESIRPVYIMRPLNLLVR